MHTLQVIPAFAGNGFAMAANPFTYPDLTVGVLGLGVQPLPPAVRPVTVYVQGVVLSSAFGLGTTNGVSVVAL